MAILTAIIFAGLGLLGAALSKLLADEFKAWAPSLVSLILAVASRALPPSLRTRYDEEWQGHVNETLGDLGKVYVACGCVFGAWRIAAGPFGVSKRLSDIIIALMGLILLWPLFLLIIFASAVLSSPGPIMFRHRRVGRHGKVIEVFKFRTMVTEASEHLRKLLESDPAAAVEWAANGRLRNDPRTTAIGAVLRKSSLDELPQLFNVLKGDMSLVGPRPVTDEELKRYESSVGAYLSCRPGITGLWQVSGRSTTTYNKRVACDTFYANNWSIGLDAKILLMTIPSLLFDDYRPTRFRRRLVRRVRAFYAALVRFLFGVN